MKKAVSIVILILLLAGCLKKTQNSNLRNIKDEISPQSFEDSLEAILFKKLDALSIGDSVHVDSLMYKPVQKIRSIHADYVNGDSLLIEYICQLQKIPLSRRNTEYAVALFYCQEVKKKKYRNVLRCAIINKNKLLWKFKGKSVGYEAENSLHIIALPTSIGNSLIAISNNILPSAPEWTGLSLYKISEDNALLEFKNSWLYFDNWNLPKPIFPINEVVIIEQPTLWDFSLALPLKLNWEENRIEIVHSDTILFDLWETDRIGRFAREPAEVRLYLSPELNSNFETIIVNTQSPVVRALKLKTYKIKMGDFNYSDSSDWLYVKIGRKYGWIDQSQFFTLGFRPVG